MTRRRKGPTERRPWQPLGEATWTSLPPEPGETVWLNDRYVVHRCDLPTGWTHLSIRTATRSAHHDWRDFQRIKNELCGPEREGLELYPAESRLVDSANQFHVWVAPEGVRLPIGFHGGRSVHGPADVPPDELIEEAARAMGVDAEQVRRQLPTARQRRFA